MEELIGKEIRGFRFNDEDYPDVGWESPEMDLCIRVCGVIESYTEEIDAYTINFGNESWDYPAELVKKNLEY